MVFRSPSRFRMNFLEGVVPRVLQGLSRAGGKTTIHPLAQSFGQMIRERQADKLDAWLAEAEASGLPDLRNFATSLHRDYAAVQAGLSLPGSQGQVEGQVNRLKVIKRSMYGRGNFDLLRRRVLHRRN